MGVKRTWWEYVDKVEIGEGGDAETLYKLCMKGESIITSVYYAAGSDSVCVGQERLRTLWMRWKQVKTRQHESVGS